MKTHTIIDPEVLKYVIYDKTSKTKLRWTQKPSKHGKANVGDEVGSLSNTVNRYYFMFRRKRYANYRVIYLMFNDDFNQSLQIDHIDGDSSNDSIENLRQSNQSENLCNRKHRKCSKTKLKNIRIAKVVSGRNTYYYYVVEIKKENNRWFKSFMFNEIGMQQAIEYRNYILRHEHGDFAKIDIELSGTLHLIDNSPEGTR